MDGYGDAPRSLLTVGHSNLGWGVFAELLTGFGIQRLADVRSEPYSRRHPHFNKEVFRSALLDLGILYQHFPELGGFREMRLEPSPNQAWPEGGFRNYADHMLSQEFRSGVERLLEGLESRTAVMCSEADPNRCHRRLIADYLTRVEGVQVLHIRGIEDAREHHVHPRARIQRGVLIYPPLQGRLF